MVMHVYRILQCTTGYHFHCAYSKFHADTVCHKMCTNNNIANLANRMFFANIMIANISVCIAYTHVMQFYCMLSHASN